MADIAEIQTIPVLPLRDIVVFPNMIVPLFVGREKSVRALETVMAQNKQILLVTQTDASTEEPTADDLYRIGTLGSILQLLKLPDGTVKVLVEGGGRAQVNKIDDAGEFLMADILEVQETKVTDPEVIALGRATIHHFEDYIKLNKKIATEVLTSVNKLEDTNKIADTLASHLAVSIEDKQQLLEKTDVRARLEKLYELMDGENMWLDEKQNKKIEVKKKIVFWKLPDILIVVLKRFHFVKKTNQNKKKHMLIDVPTKELNLTKYMIHKTKNIYELFGVCNHMGRGSDSGHYTSNVLNANGKWYNFNDTNVTEIANSRIVTPNGYCFFF